MNQWKLEEIKQWVDLNYPSGSSVHSVVRGKFYVLIDSIYDFASKNIISEQESSKIEELENIRNSYSIVLLDIFENVPAAKKRYEAMKALMDTYRTVEENK